MTTSAAGDRRRFMQLAGVGVAGLAGSVAAQAALTDPGGIRFPPIAAATEVPEKDRPLPLPDAQRVGYALVGLGRLTMNRLLPAFGKTRFAKPVALVSGDRAKARKVAAQYGIHDGAVYDYANFDRIADNPAIQAVYIVLPNSMHAEFTLRAARAGKHVLCEKPMAVSVAECEQMISACQRANVKLMVAYRSQYEPQARRLVKLLREGRLGAIRSFSAFNGQNQGDPAQWRLKRALAGGGSLPDVGVYCLNAARFISGQEPTEVTARIASPPGDPRFTEVEDAVQFVLQFPGGWLASCGSSYSTHKSQFLRVGGDLAWAEMDPAFAYEGLRLRIADVSGDGGRQIEPETALTDQFALELDHFARCVLNGTQPHTPGEEGLQDQRVMEAIYASASSGRPVKLALPPGPTRGPQPLDD